VDGGGFAIEMIVKVWESESVGFAERDGAKLLYKCIVYTSN